MNIDKLYQDLIVCNFFLFKYNLKGIGSSDETNISQSTESIDLFDFDFPN
ncbi:hypothetical protein GF336_05545 [Candidatus Woesearchaeota archaeon]|nr:hypothetical protein [Candidatus Woesearchaeota archaeon]